MKRAFVIGHPIAHSRSPLIHGHWLAEHGIAGSYEAIDVAPAELASFLDRLRSGEFVGGNVTVPHKEAVFALCDTHDVDTWHIEATNTLWTQPSSEGPMIHGMNTDLYGFEANLDASAPGWDEGIENAIVLGAGGAARAVVSALKIRIPGTIALLNRTEERARSLAAEFGGRVVPGPLAVFSRYAPTAGLLVNTSTVGMHGTRFENLPLDRLPKSALVTDVVYVPLETPLLAEARALGLRTVDGLGMLLHQAVPGFEAWFGVRPEVTADLRRRLEATL